MQSILEPLSAIHCVLSVVTSTLKQLHGWRKEVSNAEATFELLPQRRFSVSIVANEKGNTFLFRTSLEILRDIHENIFFLFLIKKTDERAFRRTQ